MAWESDFEERVLKVRNKELDTQRTKFVLEVRTVFSIQKESFYNGVSPFSGYLERTRVFRSLNGLSLPTHALFRWTIPLIFTLSSYWHFVLVRGKELTPSIAFTTVSPKFAPLIPIPMLSLCVDCWYAGSHCLRRVNPSWISSVMNEMKYNLNTLPESLVKMLQARTRIYFG